MHHNYFPEYIDHIDNNPLNNKIENLRECTLSQNSQNQKLKSNNTSRIKNVTWHKRVKKWQVQIMINGKNKYFGVYEDLHLAELVATEARIKYYAEFARHK